MATCCFKMIESSSCELIVAGFHCEGMKGDGQCVYHHAFLFSS